MVDVRVDTKHVSDSFSTPGKTCRFCSVLLKAVLEQRQQSREVQGEVGRSCFSRWIMETESEERGKCGRNVPLTERS